MDKYYHMKLCGSTWVYFDGECSTCIRSIVSASNRTSYYKKQPSCTTPDGKEWFASGAGKEGDC